MERWNGKVALVTGASRGIGATICRELVKYGLVVVGCARNAEKIEELASEVKSSPGKIHAIKCDLAQESDILAMFEEIRNKFGVIHVFINNAGVTTPGSLLYGQTSDWRTMLEVNVMALSICTREAVKLMREKGVDDGQVIHFNSVGGHRLPSSTEVDVLVFNFYCGSKFMVRALTEGLRRELTAANTHIRVASISPGMVDTGVDGRDNNMDETAKAMFELYPKIQPKDIADAVIYILQSPPHVDVNEILVQPVGSPF